MKARRAITASGRRTKYSWYPAHICSRCLVFLQRDVAGTRDVRTV